MNYKKKSEKWSDYPDIPPCIKIEKREIKDIQDVCVDLSWRTDFNNCKPIDRKNNNKK